ncbi:MAG: hypothetical protein H5T72_00830 [Actinobacteria bacterium]|nr:hypothetical protein [Actinomycetota bacterium]
MILLLGFVLVVGLALPWWGCGGEETLPPEEPAAGEQASPGQVAGGEEPPGDDNPAPPEGDAVTYQVGEGEVTYQVSQEGLPEEMLGVPVYPGASYVPGSGGSVSGSSPEGGFSTVGGEFHSADAFETVFDWYRERLGDPVMYEPRQSLATWNRTEKDRMVIVGLRVEGGETVILIYSLQGKTELFTP